MRQDEQLAPVDPSQILDPETRAFYCQALRNLNQSGVPYLVGGAYAFERYTGIARHTKDLDVFVREADVERALAALEADGCRGEITFPHWLAKVRCGENFVDIIFSSGNGMAPVDEDWFRYSIAETILGIPARIVPAEEMIWQKALIMERERFDGADVAHLLRARGEHLDWDRLLQRFGELWPVLLSHLILFGFIYPSERGKIPLDVMQELLRREEAAWTAPAPNGRPRPPPDQVCNGTVLSRIQYVVDVERWGYRDARVAPAGPMTADEATVWTEAGKAEAEPGAVPT